MATIKKTTAKTAPAKTAPVKEEPVKKTVAKAEPAKTVATAAKKAEPAKNAAAVKDQIPEQLIPERQMLLIHKQTDNHHTHPFSPDKERSSRHSSYQDAQFRRNPINRVKAYLTVKAVCMA